MEKESTHLSRKLIIVHIGLLDRGALR